MYHVKKAAYYSLFICLVQSICFRAFAADIWVGPNGSDRNEGNKDAPLQTVAAALRKARELRRLSGASVKGGIHIIIKGGMYYFYEPLFVRPEDSGTADSWTTIEAAPGEKPVFSGGQEIKGWYQPQGSFPGLQGKTGGRCWAADLPQQLVASGMVRQLWIDDEKAVRARDRNADSMNRILSWDHQQEQCWIPTPAVKNMITDHLEMVIHQWWAIAILRIRNFEVHGDSTLLQFYQPESRIQSEHPWPAPWISAKTGNSAFYLSNSVSLLDEPGEWAIDYARNKMYYWPRPGEDMNKVTACIPAIETIVKVQGTIDHPVSYFSFKGISFEHAGWQRPSEKGHVPHQAGMYMLDAYKLKVPGTPDKKGLENQAWVGRPSAAVEVSYSDYISFENCRFEHVASTALDLQKGTHLNFVTGNLFKDVGGTAILAGTFSDEATEVHLPYNPTDKREVCSRLQIMNNLITDATNEDWGCAGIGAGYVHHVSIINNEICNVSYTGISLGWGWTKSANAMNNNLINSNKITHYAKHMYDVAGIYTLSAQPSTLITQNYVDSIYKAPYAHDPNHWFYLYTDEGSSYMTVSNNWTPSEKYLQNANGPDNHWVNNGPLVMDSIKRRAGLEPAYHYLLKEKTIDTNWPINH